MIKNLMQCTSLYCCNREHKKPVPMQLAKTGSLTPFYECEMAKPKSEMYPNGYDIEKGEKICVNRISFRDAYALVEQLGERIEEDECENDCYLDYKGVRLRDGKTEGKVLSYSFKKIKIGITPSWETK